MNLVKRAHPHCDTCAAKTFRMQGDDQAHRAASNSRLLQGGQPRAAWRAHVTTGPLATPDSPSEGSLSSQAQAPSHKQACQAYQAIGFSRQAGGRATDSDTRSDSSCPARSTCWRASSSCSRALTSRSFRLSSCCWAVGYFWGRLERACRRQKIASQVQELAP